MTTTMTSLPCSPAWATPRPPDRPTLGGQVAGTARLLGQPLFPWQRYVADVAGEKTPDDKFVYRYVVLVVPRRAGKTTLVLAYTLTLTGLRRNARTAYASHRRQSAADMWRDDWIPLVEHAG